MNYYIRGDVIPPSWYMHIKTKSGKTNFVAVVILANILYWYRGHKFKADMLQKSYKEYEEQYGFTKRQIKKAFDDLERLGLIHREWRTIRLQDGRVLNNVMYIEPKMSAIIEISSTKERPPYLEVTPSYPREEEGVPSNVGGGTLERRRLLHSSVGHIHELHMNYTRNSTRREKAKILKLKEKYKDFTDNEEVIDVEATTI